MRSGNSLEHGINMTDIDNFIDSCIFIHDDTSPGDNDVSDWDINGTKPFILGARHCVAKNIECFGNGYKEYLRDLGCFPKQVFIPKSNKFSLIESLLADEILVEHIKSVMCKNKLDISTYYSRAVEVTVQKALTTASHTPSLYPSPDIYSFANNKIAMWQQLSQLKIPLPIGDICHSVEAVRKFYLYNAGSNGIIIKQDHWKLEIVKTIEDIDTLKLVFPVLVEVLEPTISSPITHNLVWNGRYSHLFTVQQSINGDYSHGGNYSPVQLSEDIRQNMIEISSEVLSSLNGLSGICGIDFIINNKNEIRVVDINPRFNSSTYPYYFLHRMGLESENVYTKYGFLFCDLSNLDEVFIRKKSFELYSPKKKEGVFFFSPVFDDSKGKITQMSYFCIANSLSDLNHQIRSIRECFNQNN